jgi:hypothetical protein
MVCYDCADHFEYSGAIRGYGSRFSALDAELSASDITRENRLIGFEAEVEVVGDETRQSMAREVTDAGRGLVMCKEDSTIRNGFEIVSVPMTWRAIKDKEQEIANIFALRSKGLRADDRRNTGFHVHMTRSQFSNDDLYRMLRFFQRNDDQLVAFSRRERRELREWADMPNLTIEQARHAVNSGRGYGRNTALNLTNSTTVEIRLWNGTVRIERVFARLEFCRAIAEFIKKDGRRDWIHFDEYVSNHPREYGYLVGEMRDLEIGGNR